MGRHPVTSRIDEAIALLERYGQAVTVEGVIVNAKKKLTYADFSSDEACEAMLRLRIPSRFKALGYSISDAEAYQYDLLEDCTAAEFAERVKVKEVNAQHIERNLAADQAVADFLTAKTEQLGREVKFGDFVDEIEAIYVEHGLAAA